MYSVPFCNVDPFNEVEGRPLSVERFAASNLLRRQQNVRFAQLNVNELIFNNDTKSCIPKSQHFCQGLLSSDR